MVRIIVVLIAVVFSTHSYSQPRATDYFEAMSGSFYQKYHHEEAVNRWSDRFRKMNNDQRLDDINDCYGKSKDEVIIVLQIEDDGAISDVFTSIDNDKAECFIGTYKGLVTPRPSISPLYKLMRMR